MASEFLKIQALNKYIKEPKVKDFSFDLRSSSTEDFLFPEPKPEEELTRIKEENFEKAKPFLMDESVDFIEREEFDKGGVAKVLAHLDSLPEGTEIDLEYIRKYIADNNIDAQPEGIFKQLEPNKINRKQIAASGNETFTYNKEKRELLTRLNKKLNLVKARKYVPATKENLEKLDNLIKNTNLNTTQIAKEMGFGKESFSFTRKNPLITEYLKKYGPPPEGRFKEKLTANSAKVKKAVELKELGLSTQQIGDELGVDRNSVRNYFRIAGRDDLVGEVNVKKPGSANLRKIARMKTIADADRFTSKDEKGFNKREEKRVEKINKYVKENAEELANNKKIQNLINLKLDRKGNILSKEKTPEEILKSIKRDRFFERDHISSVAKKKRNMQFPVNFQISPYNINQGFFNSVETYAKRPDADPAKLQKISEVLNQYGLRLDTGKGIIGAKQVPASEVIDRNLKALDLPTDIGKVTNVSIADTAATKLGMNVDPSEILRAVDTDYMKTKTPSIKGLKTVAKVGLGEAYFAPASIVMDSYAGLTGPEMALNIATFGTGVPIKDSIEKRKFLNELDLGAAFNTAMEKRRILKTAPKSSIGDYTEEERKAIFASNVFDTGLGLKRKAKREDDLEQMKTDLQSGALEVKDYTDVPEPEGIMGIEPELIEIPEDLGFFNKAAGQTPRGFLSQGGIVQTRVGFAAGSQGPIPLRVLFLIMDRLQNLKNSTFSNYNSVRMFGEQKGIKEVLSPYTNIPEKNRLVTAIEDATELKKIMPEEYHGILDEIIKDSQQFNFKTAHDRTQAVIDTLPPNLDFKQLRDDLFPMPNPENSAFILPKGYGKGTSFSTGRFKTRTSVDTFSGKGTREVYDTFDEETGEFVEPGKLVSKEPIEDELSEIFANVGRPDETN